MELIPQRPGVDGLARQLAYLRLGAHACLLYGTSAEQLRSLLPFLREGSRRRERCLYIADETDLAEVVQALDRSGLNTHAEIETGGLCLLLWRDAYLRNGRFDPDAMISFLRAAAEAARADGWAGLRVAGEMSWALGREVDTQCLIDYEARLNALPASLSMRLLCQYDERRFAPRVIRDILRTHPLAIVGEHVHDNPYFEPLLLERDGADETSAGLDAMLDYLRLRAQRAHALAELGAFAAASPPIAELASAAAQVVSRGLGAQVVEVIELRMPGKAGVRLGSVGLDADGPGTHALETSDVWPATASDAPRGVVIVPDWAVEAHLSPRRELQVRGIASSLGVPIWNGDVRLHGAVWVHCAQQRIFTEDEVAFVETAAMIVAEAMARDHAEAELRTMAESVPDAIARFDHDLRYVYVNTAVERILGAPSESLIGKTSREVGLPESLAQVWELVLRQAWRTGREQMLELSVPTPLGERQVQSRVVPEFGTDGTVRSCLSIWRDVTEQRSAEAERRAAYRAMARHQARLAELLSRMEREHAQALQRTARAIRAEQLTTREQAILRLLARGWTNREIAAELELRPGTVKNHVQKILTKLDVSDRTQAAVRAVELGLAQPV